MSESRQDTEGMDAHGALAAIRAETVPVDGHADPGAIQDCFRTVEGALRTLHGVDDVLREAQVFLAVVGASRPDDHEWVVEARRLCSAINAVLRDEERDGRPQPARSDACHRRRGPGTWR